MATQGGGKSENQSKIELLYVSEGYKRSVQELQSLLDLVDKLKGDLGKVTMPAIKGLKGALREAGELSQAIQALTHQGSVASVKPLSDKPTKKEQADYKKAMQVQAADVAVRQAQLDTQDKTLRLQRQLAAEKAKELERQAFSGKLTQDQIKAQAGNIDNLKAIARGLEQSAKAGKAHAPLQQQVTTLLTEEISRRKLKATTERQLETQARQEERKVALEYARKAARSGDTGALKDYLKNAELQQVKNLEYAMRAEVGRKGYTKTSSVMDFNALVAERRKELTKTSPIVESSSILESIKAAKHKGDANYILSQAQAELRRQVKEGASPESLRQLYRTLADAKSEAAKKFAPISPYQEAKTAEETYAKNLLSARFNKKTIAEASTAQIEAQLKASKILGHKTLAPFGSPKHQKEMGYQKFLTDTIKARALETPEAKEAKQRKESSSENFKIRQQELAEAKKIIPLTTAEVSRLSSQSEVEKHLHAIKVRGLKLGQDGYQDEVKYRQQLKNRLTELQKELSEDKKKRADPAAYDLAEHRKSLRTQTQTQLEVNSTRSAERLKAKIAVETLKEQDLKTGKYSTVAALSNLPVSELKTARDTINYGVKQGLMSVTEAKELISKTKELEKAEVQRLKKLNEKGTIYRDSLGKIKSGDVLGGLEGLSLRQLKKLQTQLLSHLDLTGLDTKVKENFKRALVQIDGTLKSAKRGELNLLGLEAPDTSKPLKRDKQLNIFEKARQGQLSIKDLQDFQAGSTDPKRTLKELRAIQNQIRKAELDPNLITTTDKAPNRLGNFIRTQISGLNQTIADLEKASKPVKALKEKDWSTQTREAVRSDINTLGQSRDPIARQNIRDEAKRNFETKQNQAEYNKELILHKASLNQATIQQMTTSTELAKATKAIQLDNKLHPKNQEANLALTEAIKQRTKDLNYQARLRDPNFKASEDLKQNQTGLRTTNVGSLLQGQDLSSARQVAKVNAELEKQRAIQAGIFDSKDKLLKLSPEEHKFAKATLNYQYAMNQNDKVKREEAARLLNVLSDIEKANRRATAANQNLANLAHKYTTTGEIRAIQDRAEAELARKVVAYRMRSTSYTEEELKHQQKLLDAAKSRDHLLTSQANRQDKERQNERRLTQLTHLEGDGGASMAIAQAGFMMRSQVLGGLSSIFSGAFDSAVQLDKAFRNLQAISASTNYEMATMKVNLINVAQASKFSAAEVGETAVMLAQAGLSIQEIGASMKGIITLAQATGTDLAKSVDVVTSVLSIFNKSATETDTIVNQLTAALNESKLDINKMALGLQYAGNIANDSGVSFEELTAALGATANAGIRSGSTLGTGLRQMFIDLQKPNEKLTKRLETLGITLDQVSFRSQGLEGVLRNLRNAGFSSADAFETFEVRSAAAFSALSGNLTDFHDLQEELLDTNAAFEANNVQMESFAVQIDHLKSNLGIVAAEGLTPVLSLLRDFAKGLAHVMENAEEGSTVLRVLTTSFAALTVGATLAWFAKLVWHIGTTTAALMGLGRAVSLTAFGWVGLVAAIITGLAAWESATAETARLNTELDEAKGKYNDLKAALSSYGSELTNVDGAIKDLIDRYGVLSADTTQTEAVTKSLMSQFEKLGLVIDDVGSKHIDTILQKMRELRAEMAKKLLADTYETAAAEENKLYKELTAAHKTIRDNPALSTEDQALYVKKIISAEPKDLAKYEQVASAPAGKAVEAAKFALQIRKSLDSKEVSEELRTGFKELLQGLASTFEYSGKVPLDVFSAARTEYQIKSELGILQDKVAKRKLEQQLTKVMKQIEAVERTFNNPERLEKLRGETDRAAFKIQAKEIGYQPDKLLGLSQNLLANFNKELKGVNDQNHPIDLKRQLHSILAEEYLDQSGQYIEAVKKALVKAKEQGKSSMFIAELERQIGEASEMQHNYRKVLIESNKKLNKIRLNTLNEQLKEAEAALKFAEEDFKLSTGSRRADGKYKVVQQKRQTVNELRRNILKLKLADNPESEETLESFDRKINSEAKSHNLDKGKFYKSFKERAAESKNANLLEQGKRDLEARKAAEDDFYKGLERERKTLEGRQEAERFQATAKTYRPLTTGNMFDQLNTEDKKAAQAKANATGVSQEYSVLGKVKGTFSRQAARFDNESLQKKQVQEKLALEVSQLADLQQQQRNQNIAEYNKNLEKEAKLLAEVNQLKKTFEDSTQEVDKKAFDNKKAELDLIQDTNKAYREAEEKLNEAIETRNSTIENLKNNLQALIDKYDLLDTTMSAGVQSMTSGLSSIFSDWASGVIQNTEDVRDAFEALGKSVLQSMAKVVSDRIAQQFMGFILNGLGNFFGGSGEINLGMGPPKVSVASTGGLITTSGVKHFARGGEVTGTNIGRDSIPALLQPNEYVVQRSAVQALGTDFMQNLNNVTAGSLKQGAANLGGSKPMVQNVMKSSPPVNVYVVSPEQQRQMGQEDVVVALQDDILRGGTTKKLIKAVITGEI